MRGPGLFTMVQFALGLSLAGPMFIIGFEFARTGRVALGIGLFALGAVVSYAPTYVLRRIGGPRAWIRRRLRRRRDSSSSKQPSAAETNVEITHDATTHDATTHDATTDADSTATEERGESRTRKLIERAFRR